MVGKRGGSYEGSQGRNVGLMSGPGGEGGAVMSNFRT